MLKPRLILAVLFVVLTSTAFVIYREASKPELPVDGIVLLLPDSADVKSQFVQLWLDAAQEEGLHLSVIRDSALLDPMVRTRFAGLIIPDQLHRQANDAVIGALREYVNNGGKLMIVYDACTLDLNDRYARNSSRISDLAGVDYALYDRFGPKSIASVNVMGTSAVLQQLAIPPEAAVATSGSPMLNAASFASGEKSSQHWQALSGYLYGQLDYPAFRTSGAFSGKSLLQSQTGLIAGESKHGSGKVLFVNLPLGYLETRTDGLLLHSFLRYFAFNMLQSPHLASAPDGIGGLVFNLHVDAESAIPYLNRLQSAGIFNYGPFSVDLTAGPDVDAFNDRKGIDLPNNAEARRWVRFLEQRGDEVGSHGGWIHNYFGKHLSDNNKDSFAKYLALNMSAVESAMGKPVAEYSAPMGNHPEWVTDWLEKHGVVAYYFTGDSGLGPTRVYREHGRDGNSIWAFPILHRGLEASMEEMNFDSVPESEVKRWLSASSNFASKLHVVRLIYSHPLGAERYVHAVSAWMQDAQRMQNAGLFRWYTMTGVANFLNDRQKVQWEIKQDGDHAVLTASHPQSLAHQAWMLPNARFAAPAILDGKASVRNQDGYWIVAAESGKHLRASFKVVSDKNGSNETLTAGAAE